MTPWGKLGIGILFLMLYGGLIWHIKDRFDQAAQLRAIEAQVEAASQHQKAAEAIAAATEADLLTERQKTAMLAKKLGAARANKTHVSCKLDPLDVGVLKDATNPAHDLPR